MDHQRPAGKIQDAVDSKDVLERGVSARMLSAGSGADAGRRGAETTAHEQVPGPDHPEEIEFLTGALK